MHDPAPYRVEWLLKPLTAFPQTKNSSSTLSERDGLNQKTLLIFQDLDANAAASVGGAYRVESTVAKVVIRVYEMYTRRSPEHE